MSTLREEIIRNLPHFMHCSVSSSYCNCGRNDKVDEILSAIKERLPEGKTNLPSPRSLGDGDIVDVSSGYNQCLSDVKKIIEE